MVNWDLDYLKNQDAKCEIEKYIKEYHRTRPLEVLTIENGIILPQKEADKLKYPNTWMGLGGVLDQNGSFVEISGIKALFSEELVFGGKYEFSELEECGDTVLYMGVFKPHWGHFLMEYCTRLWYSVKINHKYKIAYCGYSCEQGELQRPFREFFRLLDIKEEQLIDIRKPRKFSKIIIPEQSFLRNQYYTEEYKLIVDAAYKNVDKSHTAYEKVYFTRVGFVEKKAKNKEHGEQEIQDTFERNGFKILDPETLSVGEQIFYIRNCKEFAVIPGGASANAVFAAPYTNRVYIRKAFTAIPDMFQIDQMTKAKNVVFIDCYFAPYKMFPVGYGGGPHFMGATKEFFMYLNANKMKKLRTEIYYIELIKTWHWLTRIWLKSMVKIQRDKMDYHKIRRIINRLLKQKEEKFILYPYGHIGNIVKGILDEKQDVSYLLVDHYKCINDMTICDIDILGDKSYFDYKIILCSDRKGVHHESVKRTLYETVSDKRRIVEIL